MTMELASLQLNLITIFLIFTMHIKEVPVKLQYNLFYLRDIKKVARNKTFCSNTFVHN